MNIKKIAIGIPAALILGASAILPISAESLPAIDFESYPLGSINGQDGWIFTGPYDAEVDDSLLTPGFGDKSLRVSNAITSGSFGDWIFSKPLANEAGETDSQNNGMSGGSRQPHYEVSFDIASASPAGVQDGLQVSVSPDRGDGARMSFLRFEDENDGVHIVFSDYKDALPFGTSIGDGVNGCGDGDDFVLTDVATLSRSVPHAIKLTIDFVDGSRNDVVKVWADGILVHTGTSWEDYFRYCEGNQTRTVDSLLVQARSSGGTAPDTLGEGFLIDNLSLMSGPVPVEVTPTPTVTPTPNPFAIPAECGEIEGLGAPIVGTFKSETLTGTNGNDLIFAMGGSDKVVGNGGDDCIVGGAGSDKLIGNNGSDVILGGPGADTLEGNNGQDWLYGQADADTLKGGGDNDSLIGGGAWDTARGEGGNDTCDAEKEVLCEL